MTSDIGASVSFDSCGCVCFSLIWLQFFVQSIAINNETSTGVCHQFGEEKS